MTDKATEFTTRAAISRFTFFIDETLCRPADGGGLALLTRSVDIELRDRAGDLWAVVVDGGHVLNASGGTEHEPLPSSRDDAFLARTRFPLDAALALAEAFIGIHTKYQPTGADKPLAVATHVGTGVGGPPHRGRRMNGFQLTWDAAREDAARDQ